VHVDTRWIVAVKQAAEAEGRVLTTFVGKPPLRDTAPSFPQLFRMGTAQNFVTAQFATVREGSEGTFTAKTGPERVVI
jgi:hypothetical protein